MIRWALFALPGPGDAVLEHFVRQGRPPAVVVRARADDFTNTALPCLDATAPDLAARLSVARIDLILVAGWETKLPAALLDACPLGGWNVHPSLLPAYRGHNPYFHVIRDGCAETGVTIHRITSEFDAGPILRQRRVPLAADETIGSLWHRLAPVGAEAAWEALQLIEQGGYALTPQPAGDFPRAPRITPADLVLSPELTAAAALRLVRAANPFFGAIWRSPEGPVKVYTATADAAARREGPAIPCADGEIIATLVERRGGEILTGGQFLKLQ